GFIATIQAMCDVAVGRRVLGAVGVEQVYRDASHLRLPEARVDVPSANPDDYLYPLSVGCASRLDRQVAGRALAILCMLYAVVIDALREVTLSIQQADRDEVGAVVAGGLAVVSGQHAEAAGIDGEAFVKAVLRTEVRRQGLVGCGGAGGEILVESLERLSVACD